MDVIETLRERARTMLEMADSALFYYHAPESYDKTAMAKFEKDHLLAVYAAVNEKLAECQAASAAEYDALFKEICSGNGWKMPQVGQPVRIALSGRHPRARHR